MDVGSRYISNDRTLFTVWAPLKAKMLLHLVHPVDKKIQMEKDRNGYFQVECDAPSGSRYFFMPEGLRDFPDPASRYQPQTVHGPSEVIDHNYQWNDEGWKGIPFNEIVLYELHTGTFTEEGTFDAIINKLDHLLATGVNAIELMPVAQFPGSRNWGYDSVYPYAVQNSYGGPTGLKHLVNACHQKGIAVFLDVVYNHLGPEGNYFKEFGPYFTDHYRSHWGDAINFDGPWSDGVRDFFSDNALHWFKLFHIDGLRFDAIHAVYDMGALHFWQLMHKKIKMLEQESGRLFYTIAESDLNDPKVVQPVEAGGYGFTAQWLDDFHHAIYAIVDVERGKKLYADFGKTRQLAKAYKDGFVHSGEWVNFRKKRFGAPSAGISGDRFFVFIDNHDQAGNRATGDRLPSLIDFEKLKVSSAAFLLSPYIPMLFMGEEYGDDTPFFYFISHSDKKLVDLIRDGRKKELEHFEWDSEPPDPFDEETFLRSKLNWQKLANKKNRIIHHWYQQLIRLRKTCPALKSFDKNDVWVNTDEKMVELWRRSSDGQNEIVCLFNFSDASPHSFAFSSLPGSWNKILDSNEEPWTLEKSQSGSLPPLVSFPERILVPPLTVAAYGNF